MAAPKWTESLSVFNEELDKQHEQMLALLAQLWTVANEGGDTDAVSEVLRNLLQLTVIHNATEEKFMRDHHFPGAMQHVKSHELLIHELRKKYLVPLSRGQLVVTTAIIESAARLLTEHIRTDDHKYAAYIAARGAVPTA